MKVILQENVGNLGKVGDHVTVKAGYARNYLIPQDKAVVATPQNIALFEQHRVQLEKASAEKLAAAQACAKSLAAMVITIPAQVGDEGKLFGSIGPRDVAAAITEGGQTIAKSAIIMPEDPIRAVGEYDITVALHSEVHVTVKVQVVAE